MENRLQIRKKIGQLIMPDFRHWGYDKNNNYLPFINANDDVLKLISKYNFGSIILFKENVKNNNQIINLLRDLQNAIETPLFFAIDQEGGIVNRIIQGTNTCGAMAIGATFDESSVTQMAEIIALELKVLGFNLNLGPIADINSNQNNPIIGIRSFSDDAETVTKMVEAYIKGLNKHNIISCMKHFPGHGDTSSDTHNENVSVNSSLNVLNNQELYPYKKICKNSSLDSILLAHVGVPALDNTLVKSKITNQDIVIPSTLSHKIITNLLKEDIGYKGLIITDAMDMLAIKKHFGEIEATKQSIIAGSDIIMMPVNVWEKDSIHKFEDLFNELENEYLNNSEFSKRVNESYNKIIKVKKDKKLNESILFTKSLEEQLNIANDIVSSDTHKKIELDLALKSVTMLKNNDMPFNPNNVKNIAIYSQEKESFDLAVKHLSDLYSKFGLNINICNIKELSRFDNIDLALLLTEKINEKSEEINSLVANLNSNNIPSINISCVTPYDIAFIDNIKNAICVYGCTSLDKTNYSIALLKVNLLAGIMTLFNDRETNIPLNNPVGRLPVNIKNNNNEIIFKRGFGKSF